MSAARAHSSAFGGTLVFGALAAAILPVTVLAASPFLGVSRALMLHAILATVGYAMVLTSGARRRLAVGAVSLAGGLVLAGLSRSPGELLVLLSLGLGLLRSGWLFRRRTLRAVAIESLVLVGSVAVARFLAAPGLLGSALAVWGWFVVQSFYFLIGGIETRRPKLREGDPFDEAQRELEELLGL